MLRQKRKLWCALCFDGSGRYSIIKIYSHFSSRNATLSVVATSQAVSQQLIVWTVGQLKQDIRNQVFVSIFRY